MHRIALLLFAASFGFGAWGVNEDLFEAGKPSQPALDKTYETALGRKQTEVAAVLKKAAARESAPAFVVDSKTLEAYAGTYKSDQVPLDIKVFVKEGNLYMQATGQPEFPLKATSATQFEFAPARKDGKELGRTARAELPTWGTPAVVEGKGRTEVVTNGSKAIRGYDADTGKELWTLGPNSNVVCTTFVAAAESLYLASRFWPPRHGRTIC